MNLLSESRVKAVKQFVLQILNTTLAVLIALSFEGMVEWRRIRELVATAKVHIESEIRDNRGDIAKSGSWIEEGKRDVKANLEYVTRWLAAKEAAVAGKEPPKPEGGFTFHPARVILSASSRSTAEAMGALGHMKYTQVKRYAEAYNYQQDVQRNFDRWSEDTSAALSLALANDRPLSLTDLQNLRATLLNMRQVLNDLAHQAPMLLEFYDKALAGP